MRKIEQMLSQVQSKLELWNPITFPEVQEDKKDPNLVEVLSKNTTKKVMSDYLLRKSVLVFTFIFSLI